MKIGLFGGSFNPVHNSHVKIVSTILEKKLVDEIWIIPCGNHAFIKDLIEGEKRIDMLNLAFGQNSKIKINKIELSSKEKSYTINTIKKIKKDFPEHKFYFIVGADVTGDFHKWHNYKELAEEIEFIIYPRPGYKIEENCGMKIVKILNLRADNISSSEIRTKIKNNEDISKLVPKKVENYMKKEGLYKNGD